MVRPRRTVRFARLIQRRVRHLGGDSARAADGGNPSLPWAGVPCGAILAGGPSAIGPAAPSGALPATDCSAWQRLYAGVEFFDTPEDIKELWFARESVIERLRRRVAPLS
jgi:hypothetical protein